MTHDSTKSLRGSLRERAKYSSLPRWAERQPQRADRQPHRADAPQRKADAPSRDRLATSFSRFGIQTDPAKSRHASRPSTCNLGSRSEGKLRGLPAGPGMPSPQKTRPIPGPCPRMAFVNGSDSWTASTGTSTACSRGSTVTSRASSTSIQTPRKLTPRSDAIDDEKPLPMSDEKPAVMSLLTAFGKPCSRGGLRSATGARRRATTLGSRLPPVSAGVGPLFGDPKAIRQLDLGEKIYDLFTWDRVLQESGDGGKVVICRLKPGAAGDPRAMPLADRDGTFVMKMRAKSSFGKAGGEARYRKIQMTMLNFPHHPCVMPTHEVLEDARNYYVVMQQASEGLFFESLLRDHPTGVIPSSTVKSSVRDILDAVNHLHRRGILHRDIKPDNLVVHRDRTTGEKKVMLVDFDHADVFNPLETAEATFGTIRFNAPETFHGDYSPASDLYSIGVTFYLLMTGRMPVDDSVYWATSGQDRSAKQIYANLKSASIDWACSPWLKQPLCRDFCRRLLTFSTSARLQSCEEALQHRWFADMEEDAYSDNELS